MDTAVNPKKLFVGNLSFQVNQDQLVEYFSQFGQIVDVRLISDRMTGRSKGIAFVEYATEDEANTAIDKANGAEMDGRALVVNVARPPAPRPQFGGGGDRRGGFDRRGGGNDRRGGGGYNRGR